MIKKDLKCQSLYLIVQKSYKKYLKSNKKLMKKPTKEQKEANKAFAKNMRLNIKLDKKEGTKKLCDIVGK